MWLGVIIGLILAIFAAIIDHDTKTAKKKKTQTVTHTQYQPKPLLTNYEWKNYMGMKEYAAQNDLIICPKIRLADLIEPINGQSNSAYQKAFNKIKAKHIDFALCTPEMKVKVLVELDDNSHLRRDRQERDAFVDAALKWSGYHIVHIRKFDDAGVKQLNEALGINNQVIEQNEQNISVQTDGLSDKHPSSFA